MPKPQVNSSTPVLFVDRIEPAIPFWERLGFKATTSVPEGDHVGFVILSNGKVEVMYQTYDSLAHDVPALVDAARASKTFLFVQVESLASTRSAVEGQPVHLPERKTFYGATELGVREPGGHYVTFAEFGSEA
jgi:hypothetical protein